MTPDADAIRAALVELALQRGPGRTFCPSDAARVLSNDWRPLMSRVRREAAVLCAEGRLKATQRGRPVAPDTARGPIRLGLAYGTDDGEE